MLNLLSKNESQPIESFQLQILWNNVERRMIKKQLIEVLDLAKIDSGNRHFYYYFHPFYSAAGDKKMLASAHLSISEITCQVGFKSPVYFSQIFKQTFGEKTSGIRK